MSGYVKVLGRKPDKGGRPTLALQAFQDPAGFEAATRRLLALADRVGATVVIWSRRRLFQVRRARLNGFVATEAGRDGEVLVTGEWCCGLKARPADHEAEKVWPMVRRPRKQLQLPLPIFPELDVDTAERLDSAGYGGGRR